MTVQDAARTVRITKGRTTVETTTRYEIEGAGPVGRGSKGTKIYPQTMTVTLSDDGDGHVRIFQLGGVSLTGPVVRKNGTTSKRVTSLTWVYDMPDWVKDFVYEETGIRLP